MRFRFLYFSEYVIPGDTFLFREGRAKGGHRDDCYLISLFSHPILSYRLSLLPCCFVCEGIGKILGRHLGEAPPLDSLSYDIGIETGAGEEGKEDVSALPAPPSAPVALDSTSSASEIAKVAET